MLILGIETSCDETAVAVVSDDRRILSNRILSQLDEHRPYGGVVPEIAARSHLQYLPDITRLALEDANIKFSQLDGVAATAGPGLIGGVMIGLMAAKSIALVHDIPFIAVNHMEAHALTPRLSEKINFPYLALLVSGGHSQFVAVSGPNQHQIYGTTIDDAIGEAFDKTAALLDLPYPGGPSVEVAAKSGDPEVYSLPRPLKGRKNCDFSFSGLKTAVRKLAEKPEIDTNAPETVSNLAAAFQSAVADVVADRTNNALLRFKDEYPQGTTLVAAGGVASNMLLRETLAKTASRMDMKFVVPPAKLCTDNGAMVAWAGIERLQAGFKSSYSFAPRPRWPLDELAVTGQG